MYHAFENYYVAIMAGGIGSRFWPESRENNPKQFLDILNIGKTLLQSTYDRFVQFIPEDHIFIITSNQYIPLVKEQLPQIQQFQIIAEPERKNTAPCILFTANKIAALNPNATFIVAPSDHHITDTDVFNEVLLNAMDFAAHSNTLVTLGITPTRPHTGYGYIQFDEGVGKNGVYKVKTFVEKPPFDLAKTFVESGDFLWNSGIFIWNAKSILESFQLIQPEMYEVFEEGVGFYNTFEEGEFIAQAYKRCLATSIDYAIMEHAQNVYVLPASFGWSDLGTWSSLWEKHKKDQKNNALSGENVMIYDSDHNLVRISGDKLVIIQGLSGFCIIDTGDVLLICRIEDEQKIKDINKDVVEKYGNRFA